MWKKSKEKSEKEKKPDIIKNNKNIFPVRWFDEEVGAFVKEDGGYFTYLEVIPKDRSNMQDDEIQYDMLLIAKFYKLYKNPIKWLALNFPVNTSMQRKAKNKMIETTNDPVRKKWLERHQNELELIDKNTTKREYYLMCFGKDRDDFIKNINNVLAYMGTGRSRIIKQIDKEKQIHIVNKLNNMSSVIVLEEEYDEEKK